MKSQSVLSVVVTSLFLASVSFAASVKPATNTTSYVSVPKTAEQIVYTKLMSIMPPEVNIRPPATLEDAIDFLRQASRDHDDPEIPEEARGVNLILKLAPAAFNKTASATATTGVPRLPAIRLRNVPLYDTLDLVCDLTGMTFMIRGNIVMIVPRSDPSTRVQTRSDHILLPMHYQLNKVIEQSVNTKLKSIVLPEVTLRPPATLEDAITFFRSASRDHDDPKIPLPQRGVNVVLTLGLPEPAAPATDTNNPFGASAKATTGIPVVPAMSVKNISLYDALKLVCDATGTKFRITGNIVRVVPRVDSDARAPARATTRVK